MKEQKNNGKGIFYGVIGVATLVVAIIGATFAYFTATVSTTENITGNMATVSLSLGVEKMTDYDDATVNGGTAGLVPMSNGMIEAAVSKKGHNVTTEGGNATADDKVCVDDNGNVVCQIYKITMTNSSTAAVFVDGYVSLKNKESGNTGASSVDDTEAPTTMRWAQVFPKDGAYTTALTTADGYDLGSGTNLKWDSIDPGDIKGTPDGAKNTANILKTYSAVVLPESDPNAVEINGNKYASINKNYIRISKHTWAAAAEEGPTEGPTPGESYGRETDITSALVFNQRIAPAVGDSGTKVNYYIAVWLTETGSSQNASVVQEEGKAATQDNTKNNPIEGFFTGNVTFISANGSEVSGTFQGLTSYKKTV